MAADVRNIIHTEYVHAQQSTSEMDSNETNQVEHILRNIDDESDRLLLRDIRFTDQDTHRRLHTDLVQKRKERHGLSQ